MNKIDLTTMTDQECLSTMTDLLDSKVQIGVAYIPDEETGILTRSFLVLKCGNLQAESQPEQLELPFMPVQPKDLNVTIN